MKHFSITSMPTITFESDTTGKSVTINNGQELYIEVSSPKCHQHVEYTDDNFLVAIAWMTSDIEQYDDVNGVEIITGE